MTERESSPGGRRAVYFFCADPSIDPAAHHQFRAVESLFGPREVGFEVDDWPVLRHEDGAGNRFDFVRTRRVLSHDYAAYLPRLLERFGDYDFAGLVNWHEGYNAPDAIFCVHTTGDVPAGHWGPADPQSTRNLVRAVERHRRALGLDDFVTTTEATHWSGTQHGGDPASIRRYPVPLVDVEIGSSPRSWSDPRAAETVARALVEVFTGRDEDLCSLLCVGGVHLEAGFAAAVLADDPRYPFAVTHVLANQWVVAGGYDDPSGLDRLAACADSIRGGVDALVYHDNLKGTYKQQVRALAERRGVPAFKHQKLRRPETTGLW